MVFLAPTFVSILSRVSRSIQIYLGSIDAARWWRYFRNSVSADNMTTYDTSGLLLSSDCNDFLCVHDLVHTARSCKRELFNIFFFAYMFVSAIIVNYCLTKNEQQERIIRVYETFKKSLV